MNLEELTQMYNLAGRTIAISGGTGVLGGEMACMLVGLGANVAILDRNIELSEVMKKRLGCGPGCAITVYANVMETECKVRPISRRARS
ncbi:MAG TPA: hypothetical protein VHO69_13825, partial [Phototrophicaceae bacterium]|nr:hypothetical protein [Phototrophicaceae bacterium]